MGNRAIIKVESNKRDAIHVHWNGGLGSVTAFVNEANKRHNPKSPEYIYELYGAIREFFSYSGNKKYRERSELNVHIYAREECTSSEDNGVYSVRTDGTLDTTLASVIEDSAYTEACIKDIAEFFEAKDALLKAADWEQSLPY